MVGSLHIDDFTQRVCYEAVAVAVGTIESHAMRSPYDDRTQAYIIRQITVHGEQAETWAAGSEVKVNWVSSRNSNEVTDYIDSFEVSGDATAANGRFKTYDEHEYIGMLGKPITGSLYFRVANHDSVNTHTARIIYEYEKVTKQSMDLYHEVAQLMEGREG